MSLLKRNSDVKQIDTFVASATSNFQVLSGSGVYAESKVKEADRRQNSGVLTFPCVWQFVLSCFMCPGPFQSFSEVAMVTWSRASPLLVQSEDSVLETTKEFPACCLKQFVFCQNYHDNLQFWVPRLHQKCALFDVLEI